MQRNGREHFSPEQKAEAVAIYHHGSQSNGKPWTFGALAQELKVSDKTLKRWVKKVKTSPSEANA